MCRQCQACLREDCGACNACLDKPKFGGPNRLRKKCLERKCPYMTPHSFIGPATRPRGHADVRPGGAPGPAAPWPPERRTDGSPPSAEEGRRALAAAERRWSDNLAALRPCVEPLGHINYLAVPDPEVRNRVKNFVKEQRKQHRRRLNGESTSMTDERLELLAGADFPFVFKHYSKGKVAKEEESEERLLPPTSHPPSLFQSSLDLLCSITSQSFEEAGLGSDEVEAVDSDGAESRPPSPAVSSPSSAGSPAKAKVQRARRGRNCGQCEACLRKDCGECRACKDKTKFGGPNTMKRRCLHRYCHSRKQEERPPLALSVALLPPRADAAS
jgi:hypothetical protein